MVIKVGINSFGRIGRVIFRTCCDNSEIEVSAINDPAIDLEYMCYLIKFDSTHGRFSGTVSHEADEIKVNDRPIKVFHQKAPADIPWHEAGVQYVIEASGMFTSVDKASLHLSSDGVRRVIVTGPSADAPMLILGVNENTIQPEMKVISCASSTLYCLAPIVKILEDSYGVADGFVTSIHAMTPSLRPLDGLCVRGKHWRDHRSIHQNIIPAATGACRALGRIVPACAGRLAGLAFRVPVVNGSVLDLTVRLNKDTTVAEISNAIEESENRSLRNVIQASNEKTVSSDFARDTHSCTLDTNSSLQIKPNFFKLICWYENEYSYSCRVIETVLFLDRQFQAQVLTSSGIMYMGPARNVQNIDNSQGDVIKQYVSFCVPNLQYNLKNLKPGSRKFEMRPSTTHYPIHQVGQLAFPEKKDPIKSYIEQLTNCKCNEKQNKIDVLRKDSSKDNEHSKAKNCFKKVETDISEMLNIAEDLLNKSSSKKLHPVKKTMNISEKQWENRNIIRKNFIAKISETLGKIRKVKMNAEDTEIISGEKTILLNIDGFQNKVLPTPIAVSPKNSNLKLPKSNLPTNIANSNVSPKKLNTYKIYPYSSKTEYTKGPNYLTIALKSEYPPNVHEKDATSTVATIVSEKLENTLNILNVTAPDNSKVSTQIQNTYNEETKTNSDNNQSGENNHAHDNKGVIEIVISNSNINIDKKPEPDCIENVKQQYIEIVETTPTNKMHDAKNYIQKVSRGKNLENIMNSPGCSNSSIDNNSEKSSCDVVSSSTVPTLSKNNSSFRNTQDIYDKLDSESISDSGSSNRICEKTSQVINITDLTYSLEDLPRLDKICRVIEISDELSDRLFSPLDDNSENVARKKWSFQDMCERIKFDDFCNDLFEKSAL